MQYEFENTSLVTGYIKELLHNFNLPMTDVYTEDTIPYEGKVYIKDGRYKLYTKDTFKEVNIYDYNRPALNLTTNLSITSSTYDTATHIYLGNYLRFIRDYHKVDLMNLYNCFGKQQPVRLNRTIKINDSYKLSLNARDTRYNYYIVPVKFNKEYTIAIEASVPYEIACIIYTNNFLQTLDNNDESNYDKLVRASYKKVSGSTYSSPFIYSTKINNSIINAGKTLWQHEKNLYLLLKLPVAIDSSITILEGKYIFDSIDNALVTDYIVDEQECDKQKNYLNNYPTRCSLLAYNNKKSYPFADRLVEYLVGSVNSPLDPIMENTLRSQNAVYANNLFKGYSGIWDDTLKYYTWKYTNNYDTTKGTYKNKTNKIVEYTKSLSSSIVRDRKFRDNYVDLNYYVDKDVEALMRVGGNYANK